MRLCQTIAPMLLGLALVAGAGGNAGALTMQECSAKYGAAKTAGTLGGKNWNEFRKSECGDAAAATPAGATVAQAKDVKPKETKEPKPAAPAAASGPAVYPVKVDAKYSKEKDARARMKTCVDQYNANKATGGNGGMKWIEKGGGYYSACNKRLKGAA